MKTTTKFMQMGKAGMLAIATVALLLSCSKSNPPEEPPPPPDPGQEFAFYTVDENTALHVQSALGGSTSDPDKPTSRYFWIIASLKDVKEVKKELEWYFIDPEIKGNPVTLQPITGIEIIANTDYNEQHPAGSSLIDIMQVQYFDTESGYYSLLPLTEYFETYGVLDWREDKGGFFISTNTVPSPENSIEYDDTKPPYVKKDCYLRGFGVTLTITMQDGTKLEIEPLPVMFT